MWVFKLNLHTEHVCSYFYEYTHKYVVGGVFCQGENKKLQHDGDDNMVAISIL